MEPRVSAGGCAHIEVEQDILPQPVAALLQPHEDGALAVLAPLAGDREGPRQLREAGRGARSISCMKPSGPAAEQLGESNRPTEAASSASPPPTVKPTLHKPSVLGTHDPECECL